MEEELQIEITNIKAVESPMHTRATSEGRGSVAKKTVRWQDEDQIGMTRGETITKTNKVPTSGSAEFTPQARGLKAYSAAVMKMVPIQHYAKKLGTKRVWKDTLVDHCRWAASRESKSVPRYIAPLYFHDIKQEKDAAKSHKCAICKSAFDRSNKLLKHKNQLHSFNGVRGNRELFMPSDAGHLGVRCQICGHVERSAALLVKHFVEAHTYQERVKFNLEWMVAEELLDDQASIRCMLGDSTRVGLETWQDIKTEVVAGLHKKQRWYRVLTESDKAVVADLLAAQTEQGDEEPLGRGYFNSQRTVALIDLEAHNLDCDDCPTLGEYLKDQLWVVHRCMTDGHVHPLGAEHRMRGVDMILMAMEMTLTARPIGVQEVVKMTVTDVELCDETRVAGTTWKMLKAEAMKADFFAQPWFVGRLCCLIYVLL